MTTGSITAQPVNLETPPGVQTASQCLAWAKTAFLKSNIIDPGAVEAPNWATHALQRQGPPAFPFVFFLKSLFYFLKNRVGWGGNPNQEINERFPYLPSLD